MLENYFPFRDRVGLGLSGFGNLPDKRSFDTSRILSALNIGYRVFDTAEMYGEGRCETLLGDAVNIWQGARSELQIVSKVLPDNATSKQAVLDACRRSLDRLRMDYIDVYLLHWRKPETDLPGVVDAFLELKSQGLILHYGVSNFNPDGIKWFKNLEAERGVAHNNPAGARVLQTRYSIVDRLVDRYLLNYATKNYHMTIMAHSPLDLGKLFAREAELSAVAEREGCTVAQLALAWQLRRANLITIPRSKDIKHQQDNFAASKLSLSTRSLEEIDQLFPIPTPEQRP